MTPRARVDQRSLQLLPGNAPRSCSLRPSAFAHGAGRLVGSALTRGPTVSRNRAASRTGVRSASHDSASNPRTPPARDVLRFAPAAPARCSSAGANRAERTAATFARIRARRAHRRRRGPARSCSLRPLVFAHEARTPLARDVRFAPAALARSPRGLAELAMADTIPHIARPSAAARGTSSRSDALPVWA